MIPVIIAIIVFGAVYFFYAQVAGNGSAANNLHTRNVLEQVRGESQTLKKQRDSFLETLEILKTDINDSSLLKMISYFPFGKKIIVKIVRAGKQQSAGSFLLFILMLIIISVSLVTVKKMSIIFFIIAILAPIWIGNKMLNSAIVKRNIKFINMFPDVLDMIVRSVKSGFPVNTAISMIVENMEDPVKSEFAQLADEIALGRPLGEALDRLAVRVNEQDIRFFVVVLKIQQETGGNLAEIMTNLSNIIRKRKQLRLKIRAMTSEGRITGYILGALPVVIFLVLFAMSPQHLEPLFNTDSGNMILATSVGLIVLSQIIVRKMVDIDI